MPVQTQLQQRRGTAASWTSTNPTLAAGEIGFETDTGKFKIGNGSTAWAALAYSAGATAVTYLFNATSGQTTFSGADANGLTLAYTVGAEQVYLNGVLQVRGSDYTATNGTSIVLASGALTSDVLNVIAYSAMTVTDTYTQAQADAKFFQNANAFVAGKNKVINGDFGVWQRGTSFTNPTTGAYTADRFRISNAGGDATSRTISQQTFTPGTAPVAGYEGTYFLRSTLTTKGASSGSRINPRIEDVRTLAGQTATLSFWAKSDTARTNPYEVSQSFGTGGSTGVNVTTGNFSTTTSWTRIILTFSMPSVSGKTIGANSFINLVIGQENTDGCVFDIWGVQLEAGSIATAFQTATGTIQGELAACMRYYIRFNTAEAYGFLPTIGYAGSTTVISQQVVAPVPMRTKPTAIDYSGAWQTIGAGNLSVSAFTLSSNNEKVLRADLTVTGATSGAFYQILGNNDANAYIGWSAEL